MRTQLILAVSCLLASAGFAADPQPDVLKVSVSGAKNDTGHIGCALFRSPLGFPFEDGRAMRLQDVNISHGRGECTFNGLPNGNYAIAVMHDENNNAKLDTNFFGIPTEGFGFSNGAKAHAFSPASFEEARFSYAGGAATQTVSITYR